MPRSHKRSSIQIPKKTVYWAAGFGIVCYFFHLSVYVQRLSRVVETDPNDVYKLLKDPVNLLFLHPKAVEIHILDKRSQMTLDFADFYMTEQLSFGNTTTLVNLVANPVDRNVAMKVNTFLNLLEVSIDWKLYSITQGSTAHTKLEEEIQVKCPMIFKYIVGDLMTDYHTILVNRIVQKYSSEPPIALI